MQIEIWLAYDEDGDGNGKQGPFEDEYTLLEDPANAVPHHSSEELSANAAHVPYGGGFGPPLFGVPVAVAKGV